MFPSYFTTKFYLILIFPSYFTTQFWFYPLISLLFYQYKNLFYPHFILILPSYFTLGWKAFIQFFMLSKGRCGSSGSEGHVAPFYPLELGSVGFASVGSGAEREIGFAARCWKHSAFSCRALVFWRGFCLRGGFGSLRGCRRFLYSSSWSFGRELEVILRNFSSFYGARFGWEDRKDLKRGVERREIEDSCWLLFVTSAVV